MKTIGTWLILLFITAAQSFPQWTVKNPEGSTVHFLQIKAADNHHIVAASATAIYTSSDAGDTWNFSKNSSFPYFTPGLLAVAGTSYIAGLTQTHYRLGGYFSGFISLDYGHSWLPVQKLRANFKSLSFISDSVGYMGGNFGISMYSTQYTDRFCFVKTTDGGFTWSDVTADMNAYTKIRSVFFLNDSLGWIASYGFLNTTDGGLHWSQPKRDDLLINDIYFLNKDIGWMFTDNQLLRTTDGGNSWMVSVIDLGSDILKRFVFVNQDYGYALTSTNVFNTVNGGIKWDKMELPVNVSAMNDITLGKDSSVWICGNDGLILTYKTMFISDTTDNDTADSDTTKPPPPPPPLPDHYSLAQNYPNPCNPVTSIRYSLPEKEFVTLKIYTLLGKEIAVLVEQVKEAGDYTAIFNAGGLTSGVYIYEFRAGSYSQSRKLLLLR